MKTLTSTVYNLMCIIISFAIIGLLVWILYCTCKPSAPSTNKPSSETKSATLKAIEEPVRSVKTPEVTGLCGDSVVMSNSTNGELCSAKVTDIIPTGTILPFSGLTAPIGYLLCNGQKVSATTYSNLRDVLGVASDGGLFSLPDLRNRYIVGAGDITLNNSIHSSALRAIPDHRHNLLEVQQVLDGHTFSMEGNRRSERGINLAKWREISKLNSDGSEDWLMSNPSFGRALLTGARALDAELGDPFPSRYMGDAVLHNSALIDVRPPSVALNYIIKT